MGTYVLDTCTLLNRNQFLLFRWQAAGGVPPAPAPEPPAAAAEAPAAPVEDQDEAMARDWLDHLYAASRLAILFSLVYLYGSPARFLLVLLLAAAGYL